MKKLILPLILLFVAGIAYSQPTTTLISQGGVVNTCAGDFFDSGGGGSNYGINENFTITFHSTNPGNTHIKMSFNLFDVEPGDTLIVYDGPNTTSPILGKYNNNNLPPNFVKASIYNVSGDLTFRFVSNGAINTSGWFASLVCIPQCQDIIASLDTVQTVPTPNDSNYIDICIGDWITFAGMGAGPGVFPQDNILYDQDSSTSLYIWDFGDGVIDTGRVIHHLYTVVRGYDISLQVIDVRGCTSANYLGARVRVSANPYGHINPIPDLCSSDDTTFITLGYNASSVIVIEPITSQQSASQKFDSTMFIPDGPNCAVQCYNTYVTFNAFAPGSTIQTSSDVMSICVNMEHSYAGDLGFTIICPNGQSVQLDPNDHGSGAYLGEPYGGGNHSTYDNTTYPCDAAYNPAGIGWTYCWSEIYPTHGTLVSLQSGASPIDSTNTVLDNNYLVPSAPFSGLIGCPLNGTWNIQICDDFGVDNGYIFWWELNLDPSLLPVGWSYSVPIDTVVWSGSFINFINDTTLMIVPDSGGTYQYTVTLYDVFGCSYDTTLTLQVVQTPEVDLGHDTTLCGNNLIYTLDAGPGDHYLWSTTASTQTIPVTTTGYYSVTVENYNISNTLTCSGEDTVYIGVLALPSVDLGPDQCTTTLPVLLNAGNPGFQYQWAVDGLPVGATNQTYTVNQSGNYSVTVAEQFGYGCEVTDNVEITYFPIPDLTIGPDSTICRHHSIKITATDPDGYLAGNDYTYMWSLDGVIYNSTEPFIVLSWLDPKEHVIRCFVTGCNTVADSMVLTVEPCDLTIPNIITPNGDGQNEYLKIPNVEFYPNSTMIIYNRWGKKVFESGNYHNEWDGADNADGVYYWVFTINYGDHGSGTETREMHGTVTILR